MYQVLGLADSEKVVFFFAAVTLQIRISHYTPSTLSPRNLGAVIKGRDLTH